MGGGTFPIGYGYCGARAVLSNEDANGVFANTAGGTSNPEEATKNCRRSI